MLSRSNLKSYYKISQKLASRPPATKVTSSSANAEFELPQQKKRQKTQHAARRDQDSVSISNHCPSDGMPISLLSFPFDIVDLILHQISDMNALICLSHTCSLLHNLCRRIFLCGLGILSPGFPSTVIRLHGDIPLLAVSIATSPGILDRQAHLEVDIFHLIEFHAEICNLIASNDILSLRIEFCSDDRLLLRDGFALFALLSAFTSLRPCCVTIEIRRSSNIDTPPQHTFRRTRPRLAQHVSKKLDELYLKARDLMNVILFLEVDLELFCTPKLRKLLPVLLETASACEVVVHCPTEVDCQKALYLLNCPDMEKLKVIVRDSSPIYVPDGLPLRHPKLDDITLLNAPIGPVELGHCNPARLLCLPPLKAVTISANYSGWNMSDMSHLHSLEIQSVTTTVRPPNSYRYCNAVRSIVRTMGASDHFRFSAEFFLIISFPVDLTRHTNSFYRGERLQCICDPQDSDALIPCIQALHLEVDILDNDLYVSILSLGPSYAVLIQLNTIS
ncbi:hypothetical protein GALMADRAFT_139065 [Galerina marginata CBS 339.88]|uniref:F-box domain-containing protein n=1 Tax=Galerina marginata (strain CBS 339.88) TaxID=685588 RepID=A0A067T1I5_GALM3|nr:hypothetical protein GALMADRAFT_139065 [Galerina marginata CBS 339.88]